MIVSRNGRGKKVLRFVSITSPILFAVLAITGPALCMAEDPSCNDQRCGNMPCTRPVDAAVNQVNREPDACKVGLNRTVVLRTNKPVFKGDSVEDTVARVDVPDTEKGSSEVVVSGKKIGTTHVTLWLKDGDQLRSKSYKVEVINSVDQYNTLQDFINNLLCPPPPSGTVPTECKSRIELVAVPTSEKVILRGKIKNASEKKRVLAVIVGGGIKDSDIIDMLKVPSVPCVINQCWQ